MFIRKWADVVRRTWIPPHHPASSPMQGTWNSAQRVCGGGGKRGSGRPQTGASSSFQSELRCSIQHSDPREIMQSLSLQESSPCTGRLACADMVARHVDFESISTGNPRNPKRSSMRQELFSLLLQHAASRKQLCVAHSKGNRSTRTSSGRNDEGSSSADFAMPMITIAQAVTTIIFLVVHNQILVVEITVEKTLKSTALPWLRREPPSCPGSVAALKVAEATQWKALNREPLRFHSRVFWAPS